MMKNIFKIARNYVISWSGTFRTTLVLRSSKKTSLDNKAKTPWFMEAENHRFITFILIMLKHRKLAEMRFSTIHRPQTWHR